MAIPSGRSDLEYKKFKESTATAGQTGIVVLNPDGSNVGGAAATQDVNIIKVNGVAVNMGTGAAATGTQRVAVASDSTVNNINIPSGAATNAITVDVSTALEASTVTKASAGRIYGLFGRIDKTCPSGDYWVQVLNAASLPADGAVTLLCTPLKKTHVNGVDSFFDLDLTKYGIYASTGIVVCLSTTEFTKTIGGAYLSSTVLYS